jgi:hypothetical protein
MIVGRHPDGRIVLLAKEHGLDVAFRNNDGHWYTATIVTGAQLDHFARIMNKAEQEQVLKEALQFFRNRS